MLETWHVRCRSYCCDKMPREEQAKGERLCLDSWSITDHGDGEGTAEGPEAGGHIVFTLRKQSTMDASSELMFSKPDRNSSTHREEGSSNLISQGTPSQICPEAK